MARSDWEERVGIGGSSWVRRDNKYYVGRDDYGWELREHHSWYLKTFSTPESAMDYADTHYPMEKTK